MLAVKELEKETYRGLVDRLEDSKAVDRHLGLERVPHFTTPRKFLQRTPRKWRRNVSEGGWGMLKRVAGDMVRGDDEATRDRHRLLKPFAVDLCVAGTRHSEELLLSLTGRISAGRRLTGSCEGFTAYPGTVQTVLTGA